jgi:HTH-type transcriptional regulator / antitoxin MqsA
MSELTRNGHGRRCPVCERGILKLRLLSEEFEYTENGDTILVRTQDVPVEDCDVCGESFSGPKAARIRHWAIGHALRLLPAHEIRTIRERLGQSLDQFAKLIGITTERLAQWEDGTLWQDRTADRLLRLIALSHENAKHLESLFAASPGEDREDKHQARAAKSKKTGSTGSSDLRESGGRSVAAPRRIRPMRSLEADPTEPPSTLPPPSSSPESSPRKGSSGR